MSIMIMLECDDCGEAVCFDAASVPTTEKRAIQAGWRIGMDGKDFCARCKGKHPIPKSGQATISNEGTYEAKY